MDVLITTLQQSYDHHKNDKISHFPEWRSEGFVRPGQTEKSVALIHAKKSMTCFCSFTLLNTHDNACLR